MLRNFFACGWLSFWNWWYLSKYISKQNICCCTYDWFHVVIKSMKLNSFTLELHFICVIRGWNDYSFRCGDSIKLSLDEVDLEDMMSLGTIKLVLPILIQKLFNLLNYCCFWLWNCPLEMSWAHAAPALHYQQCWALQVFFLVHSPQIRKRFSIFLIRNHKSAIGCLKA